MLWIKREHQSVVKPPVTSWELGKSLPEQFFNQGTRDLIPFVCVKDSLRFYEAIGGIVSCCYSSCLLFDFSPVSVFLLLICSKEKMFSIYQG